jgi:hypothetical protein
MSVLILTPAKKGSVGGKIIEKLSRLIGKLNKLTDPERTLALLDLLLTDTPDTFSGEIPSYKTYVLESAWTYDHLHTEFATICIEELDIPFEELTSPYLSHFNKAFILGRLTEIYKVQVPHHGNRKMVRLYRVLDERTFGFLGDSLVRDAVDVHFVLKPICDFDKNGNPVPCEIKK